VAPTAALAQKCTTALNIAQQRETIVAEQHTDELAPAALEKALALNILRIEVANLRLARVKSER